MWHWLENGLPCVGIEPTTPPLHVGTAGLLSKQWTSIRHILSLLVTANACVHVTAYVAVRRSLSTTYTAVFLGLLLRQYVSYQFGVWAAALWRPESDHDWVHQNYVYLLVKETDWVVSIHNIFCRFGNFPPDFKLLKILLHIFCDDWQWYSCRKLLFNTFFQLRDIHKKIS